MQSKSFYILTVLFVFVGCSDTHYRAQQIVAELDSPKQKRTLPQEKDISVVDETLQQENLKKEVNTLETSKNYNGLKEYTDKYPNAVYYINDELLRLAMTGPKGLKVGDLREYIQNGKSELILLSMIKQQELPYKKFTLHEIDLLVQMGLTDKVISTMIDLTTNLLRDEKLQKQQEYYLQEQKNIAAKQPPVIYQTTQNQSQQQPNDAADKVKNEVIKQGVGILLDQLFH